MGKETEKVQIGKACVVVSMLFGDDILAGKLQTS